MSIKCKVILSFCIIAISYCNNRIVSADEKVESNTIVIQSGGGGHDDHEDENEIIYTTIPIPIPLQLRKSVVNPSYLYPIHQDPSLPSYQLTQRSIIHVPSPAPQLHPTPDYFINRFRTVPPNDHFPPSPDPNYRHPLPSSHERQSNGYDLPSQQRLPLVHPSTMRSLPTAPPSLTEPAPSPSMDSRPPPTVATPSFTPPFHPMPNVAQENNDRDNRYYSLHEPWPPSYSNSDKNIKPSSTEVQDGNNKDDNTQNNDNSNYNNNNNNNMADSDDGRDEGRGEADYPPGDQDYVANQEGQDYNGDYREGYQPVEPVKNVIDGAPVVNGPVFGDFYHPEYPDARDYPDFPVKSAVGDQLIDQTNMNLPSGSQEIINFQDPGMAVDYQNAIANDPIYPMDPGYIINDSADHQSNQDKQPTYSENQDRPSQPPTKQVVTPQTDYTQDYRDDYYSSENNEQKGTNEQAEYVNDNDNNNENINDNNNGNNNNNNDDEEENQNNQVDRNYIPLRPESFDNRESTTSGRLIDYSESNYNNGYNDESSTNPIDLKTMVTFPLNSGTELGVRPDLDHSGPMTEFDLTGDPYLDNQVQQKVTNSMENHLNSLDHGQFGRRNEPLLNDNQMKPEPSSVAMNDYLAPGDQQDGEQIQPGQYTDENNNWQGENGDYNEQSKQLNLPSTPSILSNRLKQSTEDLAFNNQGERFDQDDWGNY